MALMHLASRWLSLKGWPLTSITVLTVDHGLRPESSSEAAFVAGQAEQLGFAHVTLTWAGEKPKTGIQAAARQARYELMTAYCRSQGIACLATAHTEDDQAETFLMRLRRGSGLDGLAAIAAVSLRGEIPIVRPLLGFSKARIIAYLRSIAVPFIRDPSNANTSFERVRLRHAMKALTAAGITRPALSLTASRLGRSREALSAVAADFLQRNFRVTNLAQGQIGRDQFFDLPSEIALRVLSQVLTLIGGKQEAPRMAKVERLLEELRAGKREAALGGCLAITGAEILNFYREPGRMGLARLPCRPGRTCTWDGRFLLTFASGLSSGLTVAPLGARGWTICRKALKERRLPVHADRLAALTTPAIFQGGRPIFAPVLGFSDREIFHARPEPFRLQLVPRLGRFLKTNLA